MEVMEIERKFLIKDLPDLSPYQKKLLIQGYLCTAPVVRVRQEGDEYVLTYKGGGLMAREEYNLPLNRDAFQHLLKKTDGRIITKNRYYIPYGKYTIELDIFEEDLKGLIIAEVEFESIKEAESFLPPKWFDVDVTNDRKYHNSYLSCPKGEPA